MLKTHYLNITPTKFLSSPSIKNNRVDVSSHASKWQPKQLNNAYGIYHISFKLEKVVLQSLWLPDVSSFSKVLTAATQIQAGIKKQ